MNLTPCGNASAPKRLNIIKIATARMLPEAEYIFSPARTCNSPQSALSGRLPDGRPPESAQGSVKPRSRTNGQDELPAAKPPQTILERLSAARAVLGYQP